MKSLLILLFVTGCWNNPDPDWHCTCSNPPVDTYYLGYSEDDINKVIETAKADSIELVCVEI